MNRNVHVDYSFKQEMIIVTIIDWVFQAISLASYGSKELEGCIGIFSRTMVVYSLRGIAFTFITAVYPLFISTRGHFLLTPTKAMDEFRYFIMDELCAKTYMKFLERLDEDNDLMHSVDNSMLQKSCKLPLIRTL